MANEFDYIELFGTDFGPTLAQIVKELSPELEEIILSALDQMVYDTQIFTAEINRTIINLESNGALKNAARNAFLKDMVKGGRVFGRLENRIKEKIIGTINQSSRFGQYEDTTLNQEFVWITVGGHRICQDCSGRAGDILPFSEWESIGLPGSGWSVCQGYCYCVLDPTGKVPTKIDLDIAEKIPR